MVTKIDSSPLMRLALAFLRGQGRSENTQSDVIQDTSKNRCSDTTWVESSLDQTMNRNVMKFIDLLSPQAQAYEEWLPLIVVCFMWCQYSHECHCRIQLVDRNSPRSSCHSQCCCRHCRWVPCPTIMRVSEWTPTRRENVDTMIMMILASIEGIGWPRW